MCIKSLIFLSFLTLACAEIYSYEEHDVEKRSVQTLYLNVRNEDQLNEYKATLKNFRIVERDSTFVCDDGSSRLNFDWDNSSDIEYACKMDETIPVNYTVDPIDKCNTSLPKRMDKHYCTTFSIKYPDPIPDHGPHRSVWPTYGEYLYCPPARWLHSVEHGAVVMLYHPCADPYEVQRLREILTHCVKRHVITPHRFMTLDRPLGLMTWSCRYLFSRVNETDVKRFIKTHFKYAPEAHYMYSGAYDFGLKKMAEVLSTPDDAIVCPEQPITKSPVKEKIETHPPGFGMGDHEPTTDDPEKKQQNIK